MNVFELACMAPSILGAVVGTTHHAAFGVVQILDSFIGAALGILAHVALVLALALIFKISFGASLFEPKKKRH